MATLRLPILNATVIPDDSGDVFFAPITTQLTLTNASAGKQLCVVMKDPNGAGDQGIYGSFLVPKNYAGTPKMVAQFILDGSPSSTTVAVGVQQLSRDDSEAWDAALETEDTASNATWTGYADEDVYEISVTLTPAAAYVADDQVRYFFFIDDGTHTYTGNLLLVGLFFEYSDT